MDKPAVLYTLALKGLTEESLPVPESNYCKLLAKIEDKEIEESYDDLIGSDILKRIYNAFVEKKYDLDPPRSHIAILIDLSTDIYTLDFYSKNKVTYTNTETNQTNTFRIDDPLERAWLNVSVRDQGWDTHDAWYDANGQQIFGHNTESIMVEKGVVV